MKYLGLVAWICLSGVALATGPASEPDNDSVPGPLLLANQNLVRHIMTGDFEKALSEAERIVTLVNEKTPYEPTEHAAAFLNLAITQKKARQFSASEKSFEKSISMLSRAKGTYAKDLLLPLKHQAGFYYQQQRYEDAMNALLRAQHITHRSDGVYTMDQLTIVDWLTSINIKAGRIKNADSLQKLYYRINEKNYGADDQRMIPAMTKLADWFRASGQYRDALQTYRRSLTMVEKRDGDSELESVSLLRAISSVLYIQGNCCPDEPLDRSLNIVMGDPTTDAEDRLDALIQMADLTLVKKDESRARKLYRKAWKMITSISSLGHKSKELFEQPTRLGMGRSDEVALAFERTSRNYLSGKSRRTQVVLANNSGMSFSFGKQEPKHDRLIGSPLPLCHSQVLDLARTRREAKLSDYYIDLDFTVDQNGKVRTVEVVNANIPARLTRYVKNMLRSTRYRPRMVEGEPVITDHVGLHQTFTGSQGLNHHSDAPVAFDTSVILQGCQLLAAR